MRQPTLAPSSANLRRMLTVRTHGAQERLKALKREIIRLMQGAPSNSTILNAQHYLGRSLHRLQDFYSHSNWVEQHLSEPMNNLEPFHFLGDINAEIRNTDRGLLTCEKPSVQVIGGSSS